MRLTIVLTSTLLLGWILCGTYALIVSRCEWTWVAGSNDRNQKAVVVEIGEPSQDNIPGARSGAIGWYDSAAQELWLLGGQGQAANGIAGE